MRKQFFAGIVILLAVLFVTCEDWLPEDKDEVEYTDVVYSEDRTKVTLYLDGIGVPKTQAQRAMSLRLAKMAYDYLEVIFIDAAAIPTVARAQWELGQSAGISGVARGTSTTGITYSNGATTPTALMAAGRKDGKTLLAIGELATADKTIYPSTKSVTFELHSIHTALLVGTETKVSSPAAATDNTLGILYDNSLAFTTDSTIVSKAKRSPLGGSQYPMYILPNDPDDPATTGTDESSPLVQNATYTFGGAAADYASVIKLTRGTTPYLDVEVRLPRYQENGRYFVPPTTLDMRSDVKAGTYTSYSNVVPLVFTRAEGATGIFSFYIDIPVYILNDLESTNGGKLKAVKWHITTGLGSELYSLDDGLASGGCVLMGIGVGALDWLDINWIWKD